MPITATRKKAAPAAVALPPFTRAAEVRENSFNEDDNTIEVVWAAGAKVRRYSWRDGAYYDEALVMKPEAVRLGRLNAGAPFLDSHNSYSLRSVIGSVVPGSAKIERGKGVATVKLSRAPEDAATVGKIADGIIRNISVGYVAHRIEKTEPAKDGGVAEWRVLDWEPLEISAVPIPADPDAQVRGADGAAPDERTFPCIFETRSAAAGQPEPFTMTDDTETTDERAQRAEQKRVATLHNLGEHFNARDFAAEAISNGTSERDFRAALIDRLAEQSAQNRTIGLIPSDVGHSGFDNPRFRAEAMGEAIACRANPALTPSEPARRFVGLSLPELAREHLAWAGVETRGLSRGQVVSQAFAVRSGGLHTTSDFALVLSSAVGRVLRPAYEATPSGLKPIARRLQLEDFRARTMIAMSGVSGLERVNEHGEYKRATLKESGESVRLETFGKIFGITRQAIINDDLGAFDTLPRKFGIEASNFEAEQLAALLASNPVMADGTALFHANHSNLAGTGAAPSEATLSAARKALRLQTDQAGKLIGVAPRYLVVGAELETDAEKLMAAITPTAADDVQPIKLAVAVEPRLAGKAWYTAADPAHVDGLVFAHLSGTNGPEIETKEGFDVDGVEIKVRLDFGCAFIDWRSWFKNPGAA